MLLKKSISVNQSSELNIESGISDLMDIEVDSINNNQMKKIMISQTLELLAIEMGLINQSGK